jgi:uncharacterized protein (TIGR01244 family)
MPRKKVPVIRSLDLTLGAVMVLLAITSAIVPAHVQQSTPTTIENFGKVNDSYYRGSQPEEAEIAQLKQLGIKTVLDLRKDREREEEAWVTKSGMQYFNIPMKSSEPATAEQAAYFLVLVNDPANWPVYVHCKGGRHRTGALTAVYRITHDGWTAEKAFQEMKHYQFDHGLFGGPPAQKKFVFAYYDRHRADKASMTASP